MFKLKLESETLKLCLKTLSYDVKEWIPVRERKKKKKKHKKMKASHNKKKI